MPPDRVPAHACDFERIYRSEVEAVWRFIARLGISAADVEDLVHNVFFTAFGRLDRYDPTRPARPWLFGIAYRLAADFRALKRHAVEVAEGLLPDAAGEPVRMLEQRDANRVLEAALTRMDPPVRAVFVMHVVEGRAVPQIAAAMETPVGTAYTRLRTGRQIFAEVVALMNGEA